MLTVVAIITPFCCRGGRGCQSQDKAVSKQHGEAIFSPASAMRMKAFCKIQTWWEESVGTSNIAAADVAHIQFQYWFFWAIILRFHSDIRLWPSLFLQSPSIIYHKVFHSKACRRGPFFYVQVFKRVLLAIFLCQVFSTIDDWDKNVAELSRTWSSTIYLSYSSFFSFYDDLLRVFI